jgi:hypothetical protein
MNASFGNHPTTQVDPAWCPHYCNRAVTVEKTAPLGTHTLQKTLKFSRHKQFLRYMFSHNRRTKRCGKVGKMQTFQGNGTDPFAPAH